MLPLRALDREITLPSFCPPLFRPSCTGNAGNARLVPPFAALAPAPTRVLLGSPNDLTFCSSRAGSSSEIYRATSAPPCPSNTPKNPEAGSPSTSTLQHTCQRGSIYVREGGKSVTTRGRKGVAVRERLDTVRTDTTQRGKEMKGENGRSNSRLTQIAHQSTTRSLNTRVATVGTWA